MTYLGIDYGSRHVGLALGDNEVAIASPFRILENEGTDQLCAELQTIINKERIEMIVVGVPMLGTLDTRQRDEVEQFIGFLSDYVSVPVHIYDESFTSQEAHHRLRDTGQKEDHAVAAMLILQGFFDTGRS